MPAVSVIVTTRNEESRIGDLMRSLHGQSHIAEVVLVDAESDDDTVAEAQASAGQLRLVVKVAPCGRGGGRNIGARHASGDMLAFIDGDCSAQPGWTEALVDGYSGREDYVVAGRTVSIGRFRSQRAPLLVGDQDVTWPSCNLAYPRALFDRIGGFDEAFVTAEDVDLNIRAVQSGATIIQAPDAVVHASTRSSTRSHLRQAYDYGIGRAQLEAKHGKLARTSKRLALRNHPTPAGLLRLAAGYLGYRKGRRAHR